MSLGLNSLRAKTLAVVCVLVVAPVVFVWLSSPFEDALGSQLRSDVQNASEQIAHLVRMDAPIGDYAELARRFDVWVRVIDPQSSEVVVDTDGTRTSLREWLLFVPQKVPRLAQWDATQPPLPQRREVEAARRDGRDAGCNYRLDGRMLVCHLVERVGFTGAKPKLLHLSASYSRGASGLYDERFQILKVMVVVLAMAAALGLWLAYRIGTPLRRLRDQVLERTRTPVSTTPVERGTDDEFGELADAFNELLGALDARRRDNEAFMADMAHEIKNPVAAIRAAAESLARGADVPAARAERLANILRDSGRRLDRVVTNFLELARAESGLPEVERAEVQLGQLVENVAVSYRDDARFGHLEIAADCADEWVVGSAEHLERAVRNLVENALSFARGRVAVGVRRHGDSVEVEVSDDGVGIAPQDVARVFDRFFTRRDDGGGTGLGLAMTSAIAEAHAGRVEVTSDPGVGTTFRITLPRAPM